MLDSVSVVSETTSLVRCCAGVQHQPSSLCRTRQARSGTLARSSLDTCTSVVLQDRGRHGEKAD